MEAHDPRSDYDRFDVEGVYIPLEDSDWMEEHSEWHIEAGDVLQPASMIHWIQFVRKCRTPMSRKARAVLNALALHVGATGRMNPGRTTLACVTGFGRDSLRVAVKELEHLGLLRVSEPDEDSLTPSLEYQFIAPGYLLRALYPKDGKRGIREWYSVIVSGEITYLKGVPDVERERRRRARGRL